MKTLTKEAYQILLDKATGLSPYGGATAATRIVNLVLAETEVAMLEDYQKTDIINWVADGYDLESMYNFKAREVAIMINLPEIYGVYEQRLAAQEKLKNLKEVSAELGKRLKTAINNEGISPSLLEALNEVK